MGVGIGLGILTLVVGVLGVSIGAIVLLSSFLDTNKRARKIGAIMILGGAISLLASFSLCSTS